MDDAELNWNAGWEQPSDQITLFQGSDELTERLRLQAVLGLLFIL